MPGEAARNAEHGGGHGLFADPVLQGLHRLGCRGMHVLATVPAGADPEWTTAPVGPHGSDASGWCFHLPGADSGRGVLLEFTGPDQLPVDARRALADCLRATAALAVPGPHPGPAVLVDRDTAARCIHDLRNGLNSLLMNVAVLTTKLAPADREGRFATQVQADGERCAALLQSLSDATRPPGGPLAR